MNLEEIKANGIVELLSFLFYTWFWKGRLIVATQTQVNSNLSTSKDVVLL